MSLVISALDAARKSVANSRFSKENFEIIMKKCNEKIIKAAESGEFHCNIEFPYRELLNVPMQGVISTALQIEGYYVIPDVDRNDNIVTLRIYWNDL